jgi:putative membrane protein
VRARRRLSAGTGRVRTRFEGTYHAFGRSEGYHYSMAAPYDPHRWLDHLFDIRGSLVVEITGRVLLFVGWSIAVVWIHENVHPLAIPSTLHSLVGLALSLLLVFRTNSSYDRFWEGRKAWGGMVNESRNLARALQAWIPGHSELRERAVLWTISFAYACMYSLRGERGLGPVADRLPAAETSRTKNAQHVPLAVATRISECVAEAQRRGLLSDYRAATIDQNVQLLVDYLGVCERIHKTPIPYAYVVHLRRALLVYCGTLPFALLEPFGWVTVLDVLAVSFIFFGIEEIGVEIEDPFGNDDNDLPLDRICATIEGNLLATLEEPQPVSVSA